MKLSAYDITGIYDGGVNLNNYRGESVFPGLWLSMSDLLVGNMPQVLATLQLGLNSAEHQIFVQQLSS
ncbi:hypothetical protein [Nostoc sp.]|uniref:hypothetical protein n=1 Tax=Nostoc sp. TaxID=1180 RepID=UPI003FA59EEF